MDLGTVSYAARGYTDELPFAQRMRDVIGLEIGDGTAEVMKIIVARELMGREGLPGQAGAVGVGTGGRPGSAEAAVRVLPASQPRGARGGRLRRPGGTGIGGDQQGLYRDGGGVHVQDRSGLVVARR